MSEKMRESLSALMDDEANELELERILARIDGNDELRTAWSRYNMVRDVIGGGAGPGVGLDLDISRRVQTALAEQKGSLGNSSGRAIRERLMRPLASFAVAASVAATVVIGGQQLAQLGNGSEVPESALATLSAAPPIGFENSYVTARQASLGTLEPAVPLAYRELARQRMNRYMQEHAEQAALNSSQGIIPFARVPRIKE